jgi:dienelactone hydrolase
MNVPKLRTIQHFLGRTFLLLSGVIGIAVGFFLLETSQARASERVTFESAPTSISPFRIARAKAQGVDIKPTSGPEISARLFKPSGSGAYPAVVILSSEAGIQKNHIRWGERLKEWGYVALLIDSYGSRGGTYYKDTRDADMTADAVNGANYLKTLSFVDENKISLLGFSGVGGRIFSVLQEDKRFLPPGRNFKAAIAFYPNCFPGRKLIAPVLIFAGDNDEFMTFGNCTRAAGEAAKFGNEFEMVVYRGVTHFFDDKDYGTVRPGDQPELPDLLWYNGNRYNSDAAEDARKRMKAFLKTHIGG